ncbi:MAG: HEAT repeat domain-containing protein [Myxococcota bacterium]
MLAAASLLAASTARAQTTGDVGALRGDLLGADRDKAVAAASNLGALAPAPKALQALLYALELGLPPRQALATLEAIGLFKDAQAIDLLRLYAGHRRADLRRAALEALAPIADARAGAILVEALGDTEPTVRAKAARLCGERRERAAEVALLGLLARGDGAAAEPLGLVAGIETAKKLVELIGQTDDVLLAEALGALLLREDFGPDPLRVELVKTLGKLPGSDPVAILDEYVKVSAGKEKEERPSRIEAARILEGRKAAP